MSVEPFGFPDPDELPDPPLRVICHWSGGQYESNEPERQHYHALIEFPADLGRVRVVQGVPIENNLRGLLSDDPTFAQDTSGYAGHTKGFNSFSIGYAVCGMMGAVDGDQLGGWPILQEQVEMLITLCAQTAAVFSLEVNEETFFTHWEAQAIHRVRQTGKWDLSVIPHKPELAPHECGPWLREQIESRL